MADIEVIDESSSQEEVPPIQPAKKKGKTKRDATTTATVVPPANTLTRFLGPPAGPSSSAWEDVNLRCPVCQRPGFSSRALAVHVNHCLDVSTARKHEGTGAEGQRDAKERGGGGSGGGRNAEGGNRPASDGHNSAASSRSRKVGAGVSRAAVDRNVVKARDGEQKPSSDNNTGKKSKAHHPHPPPPVRKRLDPGATKTGVSQAHRHAACGEKSRSRPRQPHLSSPTHLSSPGATQSAPARRRGVLSRPRGNAGSDASPAPHASSGQKENEDLALGEIARTQLLCLLETDRGKTPQHGGWLGTRLFPKANADDGSVVDKSCGAGEGGCDGVVRKASFSGTPRGIGGDGRIAGTRAGRVRPRPASWDPLPRTGLEIWPRGLDDCWGDGDGYLTLRPFPSREGLGESGAPCSGGERVVRRDDIDAKLGSNGHDDDPAPTSRAERFLAVFAKLQPARRALNLEVPASPSSAVAKTTKKRSESSPSRRAAGGSADVECFGDHVAAQSGDSVPANGGVGKRSGGAKTVAVAHKMAKAGELSTPTAKRLQVEIGPRASDGIEKKQRLEASATKDNRGLRETGWENDCAAISSREPVAAASPVPPREPVLKQIHDRRQPVVTPDDQHRPTQRPSATRHVGGGNREVKQIADVIDITSESPTPPRPAAGVRRTADVNTAVTEAGMHHVACRLQETPKGGGMKLPVKSNPSPKDSTPPPLSSERPRQGKPGSALSLNTAALSCSSGGTRASQPPATPVRAPATSHRAAYPLPRERSLGGSGVARSRLEPVSVNVKRGAHVDASEERGSVADVVQVKRAVVVKKAVEVKRAVVVKKAVEVKRAGGHSQLGKGSMKVSSGKWGGSKPRGGSSAFSSSFSSGVLRSADVSTDVGCGSGGNLNGGVNGEAPEAVKATPMQLCAVDGDAALLSSQGHKADVAQKGVLTVVDAKHGATIRNSWSIDNSDELGRLEFGASLKYDAVWYFLPADDDCVGVLRYRIVPHPVLAPKGGWISEQGRLRSDPRIIVKVKPATTPPLPPARPSPTQSPLGSSQRRGDTQAGVRQGGGGAIRPSISQEQHLARHRQGQPERRTRAEEEPGSIRRTTQSGSANQAWKMKESAQHTQRERHHDHGKPQLHRHPVTTAAGALRRVQTLSAGSPEVSQTRGGFGRATSLSPEVLDEHGSATGDKVKCPMCHRGMDHWQPKQRQQHVHGCHLKEPSSAKKASLAAATTAVVTPSTERSTGISNRATEMSRGSAGSSHRTPTSDPALSHWRDSRAGGVGESGSTGQGGRPPSPTEGPRPTRLSLQAVFSPKPARDIHGQGHRSREPGHAPDSTPSRHNVSATTGPLKARSATSGINRRPAVDEDTRPNRSISASRGGVELRTDNKPSAAKGLLECPVCRLSFTGGRLGQWERHAHVQQCLDGLEEVFGSEE